LRFSNLDDELRLWVNERVVKFDGGTTYRRNSNAPVRPVYSTQDPGDAEPVGIGSERVALEITRLRVLRDVYYVASNRYRNFDYPISLDREVKNPESWSKSNAFVKRPDFPAVQLGDDQFFPMGDNSPSSKDARMWGGDEPFVRRKFLTGKAVLIYWPHSWRRPIPLWPNFKRMNFIR
jgi:signal peptidase I